MKIIIEGCDGTGKTTLAKKLAEHYNLDICHVSNKDPNDFEFYYQLLRKTNVVWDRNLIGEMIYPKIFHRIQNIDEIDLSFLIARAKAEGVIFLVLTAPHYTIMERLTTRGEPYKEVVENVEYIDAAFSRIANRYDLPLIDTERMSFDEIIKIIEKEGKHHG